jgi:hypothetical protein
MTPDKRAKEKVKVAVVTGHHEYDVVAFQRMLRSIKTVDFYPQHMEEFVLDSREARKQYDVVAFYNYQLDTPGEGGDEFGKRMKGPLEALGETGQGILMLHHALTAFPRWAYWLDICGMEDPTVYGPKGAPSRTDQKLRIEIANPDHPITRGMTSWEIVDETYNMADATEGSEVLLTTDHSESMRTIAWTRQHRNARVFSYQAGHDNQAYSNPGFRQVLERGVLWCARRI